MGKLESPSPIHHKTLSNYFTHLYSLSVFLSHLLGEPIQKEGDSANFAEFLNTSICAFITEKEIDKITFDHGQKQVHFSQQEAVDRILNKLGKQISSKQLGSNVLTTISKKYDIADQPINLSRPHIPNQYIHNPANTFLSTSWEIIRKRVGDRAFHKFIVHSALFLPVGNNCYLQLSGTPLYDIYDQQQQYQTHSKVQWQLKRKSENRKDRRSKKKQRKIHIGDVGQNAHPNKSCEPPSSRPSAKIKSPADINIDRQKMFYGKPFFITAGKVSSGLPPSQRMIPIAREILIRHSRIDYPQIMRECSSAKENREFVSPSTFSLHPMKHKTQSQLVTQVTPNGISRSESEPSLLPTRAKDSKNLLLAPLSHNQVCWFVSTVIKHLFSTETLGSEHNLRVLLVNIRRFIKAKQFETINLHSALQNIQVTEFRWLKIIGEERQRVSQAEMDKRTRLVHNLIQWIFDGFLIPLLKNTFYITETTMTKYETLYYAQEDWAKATQPHFDKLRTRLLEELSQNETFFARQARLGVSAVRLIPKTSGFRPIVNLGRKIRQKQAPGVSLKKEYIQSPNQILGDLHRVLTCEKTRRKQMLGGSLFGTNEIFAPLSNLKNDLLDKHGKMPRLHFVKMDIQTAFDTIKQDKMLGIVEKILSENEQYCIMLFALLLPSGSNAYQGTSKKLFRLKAVPETDVHASFKEHAKEFAKNMRNVAIVDLVKRRTVTTEECLRLLREHIKDNFWQIGKKYYRQRTGIPQGSKVSSLLCSFFYSYLENEYLSWSRRKGSILLRYTDDFLYVTDEYSLARRFVDVMARGFHEYGAHISMEKTLLSFEYEAGCRLAPVCDIDANGEMYFPYCGLLINTKTLDIMPDFNRTLKHPIKQSFARRTTRQEGSAFVSWYSRQLENRNHAAYLDTVHNDIITVQMNILINFALTTMKVPYYFAQINVHNRKLDRLVFTSLLASAEYTYNAGRARVRHHAHVEGLVGEHYRVRKNDLYYLAMAAMIKVLKRKASKFKGVVDLLEEELKKRIYKGMAERYDDIIHKVWGRLKAAKY
ncbi:uncharacterized protein L203_102056 [Cryptococcus depauperatus CBS 7841]|uniref:Telomerase reverse transcriptase n=1 Tax=Cryptococcus depauperatus CBS 7841 TaxID=1295531 RepID=A0AAJ8M0T4_9TREE